MEAVLRPLFLGGVEGGRMGESAFRRGCSGGLIKYM